MIDWLSRARTHFAKTGHPSTPKTPEKDGDSLETLGGGTAETPKTQVSAVLGVGTQAFSEKTHSDREPDSGGFGGGGMGHFQKNDALPPEVEARIARLLAAGGIDAEDAALVRRRWRVCPAEWLFLIGCCEAAAGIEE